MRLLSISAAFCLLCFSTGQAQTSSSDNDRPRAGNRSRFVLSDIDPQVIKEFNGAWQQCVLGTKNNEAVVLVLRDADGSTRAVSGGNSTQSYEFTFKWNPAIIAIFHTHPNNRDPKPVKQDIQVARRFDVPIFTLTRQGMFMYDPATERITKIKNGIDWLDSSSWSQVSDLASIKRNP